MSFAATPETKSFLIMPAMVTPLPGSFRR
jgi:hypothetical protein